MMANGYEKIINMMNSQSSSASNIFFTTMESSNSCYVNNLKLDSDDLLIADHLTIKQVKEVVMSGDHAIAVTYTEPLKQGDTVIVMRLNEEKYAVLERVV